MTYIYFGSGDYSVYVLKALCDAGIKPVCVVTQPGKPKGRGLEIQDTPVAQYAAAQGLKMIMPDSLREEESYAAIESYNADIFVVADYGKILPGPILSLPVKEAVCVHPSLLPRYRGSAPLNWQLINGETQTGVTIFVMDEQVDTGEIIAQEKTIIEDNDDYVSLRQKLGIVGGKLIVQEIKKIAESKHAAVTQDNTVATYAPKIKKQDSQIKWDKPAVTVFNLVRAMINWPIAWTTYKGKLLKILQTKVIDQLESKGEPGTVIAISKEGIDLACASGIIRMIKVKPEGKNEMDAGSFANGYRVQVGDIFGL